MSASVYLSTVASEDRESYKKKPVELKFEIVFFTVSGIQVKYLKISDQSGYKVPFFYTGLTLGEICHHKWRVLN
jgi:hypothetical protein